MTKEGLIEVFKWTTLLAMCACMVMTVIAIQDAQIGYAIMFVIIGIGWGIANQLARQLVG